MRRERAVFALALLTVGIYYLWAVRSAGYPFHWGQTLDGYYDLLARGFAAGHLYVPIEPSAELLAMPNPWDPAIDERYKMHDMVLYRGHYYLYFGAAPAALLFLPWRIATGHDLPENFALFLLCFGGFLFSAGALRRLLELIPTHPPPTLLALMLLALGICQSVPFLLSRVWVYEIAIGAGYFFVSGAIYFFVRAIGSMRETLWASASGVMFGLAMASRPHLMLAGLVVGLYLARRKGLLARAPAAFAAGFLAIALLVGLYNFERFGNPLEFGFRYQLAGPGQNQVDVSPRNLPSGIFYMLFCPPAFGPVFPWVRMVFRHPWPLPANYFAEPSVGALWIAPFVIAALLLPRGAAAAVRAVSWCAAAIVLFLVLTHLATERYEVDFLPVAVLAALASFAILRARAAERLRTVLTAVFVLLVAYSSIANLALGFSGPYDEMLKNRPAGYVRIARWFSPIARFRPMLDPRIEIDMHVAFRPQPEGFREPLVVIGGRRSNWLLYVEHAHGAVRLISQSEDSRATFEWGGAAAEVRVTYAPEARTMTVAVDGKPALQDRLNALVAAPAELVIGENRVDPAESGERFTGRIDVRKLVARESIPAPRPATSSIPGISPERSVLAEIVPADRPR